MDLARSLAGGVAGACTLTLINETARQFIPAAPRNDVIGERMLAKLVRAAGGKPHGRKSLYAPSMVFDVIANSAYYAVAGCGAPNSAPARGALLGTIGGLTSLVLSPALGLGSAPVRRTPATALMTVAWYAAGGWAAGLAMRELGRRA